MTTIAPLRRVASMSYGDALAADEREEGAVPVMSSGGITGTHDQPNTLAPAIVVGRKGSHGSVWWSETPAFVIDTAYSIDRSNTTAHLRWLYYVLQSLGLGQLSNDVGVPGLSREAAYEALVTVVPIDEQRRIADFLDDRVARIDQIIVARLGQVDLFSEWISASVNGLLAPDGVPGRWLRVKDVASKVGSGKTPRGGADAYVEEGVAFLRSQNVHNDGLRLDDVAFISEDLDEEMSGTRVRGGDVLLNITGGSLGRCCVADETALPANVSQHVCIIRPTRIDPSNLALLLRSKVVQDQVRLAQVGGNREGLNFEQVRELRFWHPEDPRVWSLCRSREEQGLKGAAIIRSSVSVLQTYKQSLITAAVTGEIDVTTAGCGIPG